MKLEDRPSSTKGTASHHFLGLLEEAADVKAAVSTLRGLSSSPKARRQIIVAGALEALGLAARNEDVWVRREAAAASTLYH